MGFIRNMQLRRKDDNTLSDIIAVDGGQDKPVKRKGNNRQVGFGEENVKPGDNARYLRYALVSMDLPPIDISDPVQVEQRIKDYFMFCVDKDRKPNMKGIANWLGVDKTTVNSWMRGEYRGSTHSPVIKKAVDILEELWIDFMMNGKINPASGIFLGKNMFGYKDVQDVHVERPDPFGERLSVEEIEKRIPKDIPVDVDWEDE